MTIAFSVIGILLAFGALIFAAYKKISMFLAAVLAAAIVALFGGLDVAASIVGAEGPFLIGMKDFVGSWLVVFAMGALLGALYDKSGATWRISSTLINKAGTQWTLLIYVLVGGLLVYGGIQVTVMIFVLLPFAKILFPKAGIPWYLLGHRYLCHGTDARQPADAKYYPLSVTGYRAYRRSGGGHSRYALHDHCGCWLPLLAVQARPQRSCRCHRELSGPGRYSG